MDREESTNSSEEVLDNDLGVGRSYECVFCKRGFNTAQALGGHMNIHRKDRARNKPKQSAPRFYHMIPSSSGIPRHIHQPHLAAAHDYSNSTLYESTNRSRQQPSDPDWRRMRLSLVEDDRQGKELDLELRLGYD